MNSPFRYPGGKHYARKIILPYLPGHRVYVELCWWRVDIFCQANNIAELAVGKDSL